jgi:putative transposase
MFGAPVGTPAEIIRRASGLTRRSSRPANRPRRSGRGREGRKQIVIGRDQTARLMRELGLKGVRRGKTKRTTTPDETANRPQDLVDRHFHAERPDQLWVVDLTYIPTWVGFAYLAVVIDVFARRILGWALTTHMRTDLPLEALEMAIWTRRRAGIEDLTGLIHHGDRGSQYLSIKYTERLAEAGAVPSVGSRGDSYDAMAESTIGQIKTELIYRRGPWRTVEQLEFALFEYLDWWNQRRLHGAIGLIPPAEKEADYWALAARLFLRHRVSGEVHREDRADQCGRGAVQACTSARAGV